MNKPLFKLYILRYSQKVPVALSHISFAVAAIQASNVPSLAPIYLTFLEM